jgi:hypothetical protein
MSVSSHLTPDPERRLRLIHENILATQRWADRKLFAAAFFAVAQSCLLLMMPPFAAGYWAALLLASAVLPALLGVSPLVDTFRAIPPLDPHTDKISVSSSLINEYDIARFSQAELTAFLDRYLGGGITATPYYEDIVSQIVISARITARKRRLFGAACALAGAAQLLLLAALLAR